jgi:hypothetical protein
MMTGLRTFRIGVIQSNPEKSKHLETATVQLGKFSVDFVNLRTGALPVSCFLLPATVLVLTHRTMPYHAAHYRTAHRHAAHYLLAMSCCRICIHNGFV